MLKVKDLLNDLNLSDIASGFVKNYDSGYICDCISEYADSEVDIYYSELLDWAKTHFDDINEAAREFGTPQEFDIVKVIQQGQFYANELELYNQLDDIKKAFVYVALLDNGIEEISEEQDEALQDIADNADNNTRIEDLRDETLEAIKQEEE